MKKSPTKFDVQGFSSFPRSSPSSGKPTLTSSRVWTPSYSVDTEDKRPNPKQPAEIYSSYFRSDLADLVDEVDRTPEKFRPELVRALSLSSTIRTNPTSFEKSLLTEAVIDRSRPEKPKPPSPVLEKRASVGQVELEVHPLEDELPDLESYWWLK